MRPANERRRDSVTSSLIGWVHTQKKDDFAYHAQYHRCHSSFRENDADTNANISIPVTDKMK